MSRLTARNGEGGHYFMECFQRCAGDPESGACDHCEFTDLICEKLGKYEDQEEMGQASREQLEEHIESIAYQCIEQKMHPPGMTEDARWFDYVRGISDLAEALKEFLQEEMEDE